LTNPIIPYAEPGSVTERVNLSDWEGSESIGGNLPEGNSNLAWETVTLLTIMQNPGIYIRNDIGEMVVFDHVNAEIIKKDKNGVTLKVSNPTPYFAKVSVLSENSVQSKQPLGNYSFLNWPHLKVNSGESKVYFIGNDGKVACVEK
jgi:P pilus assembly chaperone PapD